jgi:hypothetical protein
MKEIKLYICDKCGEEFRSKRFCETHEKECKAQNCNLCEHAYWVYGCEFNCELINNGKKCKFKAKEIK